MRIYLMARYSRRQEMLAVSADLEALGHKVVSRWIRGDHELADQRLNRDPGFRDREAERFAREDIEDLMSADCAIAFTEAPGNVLGRGRGGRHVEAGMALMLAALRNNPPHLILCGPRENIFMCMPCWHHYPDWPSCHQFFISSQ